MSTRTHLEQRKISTDKAIELSHTQPSVVYIWSLNSHPEYYKYCFNDLENYIINVQTDTRLKVKLCRIYIKGEILSTEPYTD